MKKQQFLIASLLWLILANYSCAPAGNESRDRDKKELPPVRALIFPEPKSLIPHEGNSYVDGQFTDMIFNNLIQANHQGTLSPELAESWDISPDQRAYTFHLRRNVRFHDGRPFTAADAAFTLENLIAKLADHYAEIRYIEGNEDFLNKRTAHVKGIRVLDDHTLVVRLNEKFKFFLPFLAGEFTAIVPRDYAGFSEADFRRQPVGTGPFRLTGYERKNIGGRQFLVHRLKKNRDYFAGTGNVEAIDFHSLKSAGEVRAREDFDLQYISSGEVPRLLGRGDLRIINSSPHIMNFLILNPAENELLRQSKVRQLIHYAIDREKLVSAVFDNRAVPAHSMIPYGLLGYNPYYRLDYSRARRLRSEVAPGKISFSIMTVTKDERLRVAEFISSELARFDVEAKVIAVSDQYNFYNKLIFTTATSVLMGAILEYPSAYDFLTHLAEPGGYYNIFHFPFPALRSKIHMLPGMDIVNETRALTEIGADFEADSFYIPLYCSANFVAIRDRIKTIAFKYGEIADFARLEVAQ